MRPLTPDEVAACRSCDASGRDPSGHWPVSPVEVCWFGCETPIDPPTDPMWCVDYDGGAT